MNAGVTRRNFLRLTGLTGGGLLFGLEGLSTIEEFRESDSFQPNRFLLFQKDGFVRLFSGRTEMGQGTNSSIRLLAAEELCLEPEKILLEIQSPKKGFWVGTGGSWGIAGYYRMVRPLFANVRQVFVNAAAKVWGVHPGECTAQNGHILHSESQRTLPYAELFDVASSMEMPEEAFLIPKENYQYLGASLPNDHLHDQLTGKAVYGIDLHIDGMLYASIERCPMVGGTLKYLDDTATLKMPDVVQVIPIEGTDWGAYNYYPAGVAVLATNSWAAQKGRKLLQLQWAEGNQRMVDDVFIRDTLRGKLDEEGVVFQSSGQIEQAFAEADEVLEATYETPFWTHGPMETMNTVAHYRKNSCELWSGCHMQTRLLEAVKTITGFPDSKITIHTPLLGGSFGRRLLVDYAIEALLLSKVCQVPVQVLNSRIDETKFGHFFSGGMYRLRTALHNNKPRAMELRIAQISAWAQREPQMLKEGIDHSLTADVLRYPYEIPIRRLSHNLAQEIQVPVTWWRGTYANTNGFIMESWIDELAIATRTDPLDFRLSLLNEGDPILSLEEQEEVDKRLFGRVLQEAADRAGWEKKRKRDVGKGIAACFTFFESYAAVVAEVELIGRKRLKIREITCAVDCGFVMNPDAVKAQVEGGIIFSLSAMSEASIHFEQGQVVENSYNDYPILTYNKCPQINVLLLESDRPVCGVGELSNIPTFAAVCNAIYDASGVRVRSLPLSQYFEV